MLIIGLTGGIGAGKSSVAKILSELGGAVIDADREGHACYEKGSIGYSRILTLFGAEVMDENEEVNRKALGPIVFNNPDAMTLLNSAIHPLIRQRIAGRLEELRGQEAPAAVVDAAVLYQAGWDDLVDEVWAVTAPPSVAISRLEQRGLAREDARRRIEAQDDPGKIADRADVVIENTGSLQELRAKVEQLWKERVISNLPQAAAPQGGHT